MGRWQTLPGWRKEYGGEPWAKVADLLGGLRAETARVWLDHVFDIEHNTNSIFNKGGTGLPETDKRDSTLRELLDYKRDFDDPRKFFRRLGTLTRERRQRSQGCSSARRTWT